MDIKKIFLVAAFIYLGNLRTVAQDVLVTKSGDALKVYRVEIGSETVFYQEKQDENAPTKRIRKEDLLIIKYADGRVVNLTETSTLTTSSAVVPAATTKRVSAATMNANTEQIKAYNSIHAHFKGEAKNKMAKVLYCECAITDDSRICDENVELVYKIQSISVVSNELLVAVRNKTQHTIYIDQGNSFFTSQGVAEPYYVPQVTSTMAGSSSGMSVNAGAVAGTLGIGGALGQLANGVTVGGGVSQGEAVSTFSQRVIAVPPMSTIELAPKYFANRIKSFDNGLAFEITQYCKALKMYSSKSNFFTIGMEKSYDKNNSILSFSNFITYSFDENMTSTYNLNVNFYVSSVVGVKNKATYDNGGAYWGVDDEQLSDDYIRKLKLLIRQHVK